jgi:hypothetical protein
MTVTDKLSCGNSVFCEHNEQNVKQNCVECTEFVKDAIAVTVEWLDSGRPTCRLIARPVSNQIVFTRIKDIA